MFAFISWKINPVAFTVGPVTYQWYGILFMAALVLTYWLVSAMFIRENTENKKLFNVAIIISMGAVVGARLGEVFFYNWSYFSTHTAEIPMIWKGGLASHGGIVGVLIASFFTTKYALKISFLTFLDRLSVASCAGLGLIRIGNLMNHEIIGVPTEVSWAFIFHNSGVDLLPRHPAQLYEALFFGLFFIILGSLYLKTSIVKKEGMLTGLFFVLMPVMRFGVEYFKNSQGGIEANFGNALTTGQLLSIPLVFVGISLILISFRQKTKGKILF